MKTHLSLQSLSPYIYIYRGGFKWKLIFHFNLSLSLSLFHCNLSLSLSLIFHCKREDKGVCHVCGASWVVHVLYHLNHSEWIIHNSWWIIHGSLIFILFIMNSAWTFAFVINTKCGYSGTCVTFSFIPWFREENLIHDWTSPNIIILWDKCMYTQIIMKNQHDPLAG